MNKNDIVSRSSVLSILNDEFESAKDELAETNYTKERSFKNGEINCAMRSMVKVNALPALDAVLVVRCKDCKFRRTMLCPMTHTIPSPTSVHFADGASDEGFCSRGARKEPYGR